MVPLVEIDKRYIPRGLILKLHGRCNLACDYCYMYESVDQSWRHKPKMMSKEVIGRLAIRIAEYMREHEIPTMNIILHGGEPLLAGRDMVGYAVTTLRSAIPPDCTLRFIIQTNGMLLDESWLEMFLKHNITVGVSLDGIKIANDRHRKTLRGGSSYAKVRRALELFQQERFRKLLGIVLAVIDLRNDPAKTYDELAWVCRNTEAEIDFLLPLGNWDRPPEHTNTNEVLYARWLLAAYKHSRVTDQRNIRLFEHMIRLAAAAWTGKPFRGAGMEAIGPFTVGDLVIETDGSVELLDGLKTTAAGEPELGITIFERGLTYAAWHMLRAYNDRKIADAAPVCQECSMFAICGGGLYANRYRAGTYDNPSVYCQDLFALTGMVADAVWKKLDAARANEAATSMIEP